MNKSNKLSKFELDKMILECEAGSYFLHQNDDRICVKDLMEADKHVEAFRELRERRAADSCDLDIESLKSEVTELQIEVDSLYQENEKLTERLTEYEDE